MQLVVKPKLFKPLQDEFLQKYVPYRPVSEIGAFTRSYTTRSIVAYNLVVERTYSIFIQTASSLGIEEGLTPFSGTVYIKSTLTTSLMGKPRLKMIRVGIPTLIQIWLTSTILGVTPMDLTTLIQATMLPMVMIRFRGGGGSREYNGGGYEFDGGSGGGSDDFGVFNFCKGDVQPHATTPVPPADDEPRDAPPIQTFSVVEGLRQV